MLDSPWSPELRVMFRPTAAYQELLRVPAGASRWSALRRPAKTAFLLGCLVSLAATQQLTLRHISDGALNASFLLLAQVVALAVVRGRDRTVSFARALDLFFAGYGPWWLSMLGLCALWGLAAGPPALTWPGRPVLFGLALAALWSAYIDLCFFRQVLGRTPGRAAWDLARLWAISWSLALVIFGGGPLVSEHMRMLGR